MNYAKEYNIILKINGKNWNDCFPLLYATKGNNIEIVKLLMNYANEHNIILKLNGKNKYVNFPFFSMIQKKMTLN